MPLQGLHHEAQSCSLVTGLGNVAFQHLTFVIDCAPQVHHFPIHPDVHLIKMPLPMAEATHPADPLATNVGSEQRAKPVPPEPHRLVAEIDAALEQQVFDVPQAEREADIHEDNEPDHLRRGVEPLEWTGRFCAGLAWHEGGLAMCDIACHTALTGPARLLGLVSAAVTRSQGLVSAPPPRAT